MKINFSPLKNEYVGFFIEKDETKHSFFGLLNNVKENKENYIFIFENSSMEVNKEFLIHCNLIKKNNVYLFDYIDSKNISGIVGFTMFDTYGFPNELTKEILEEKGFLLDENGFNILRELSKNKSKNTKLSKAFN